MIVSVYYTFKNEKLEYLTDNRKYLAYVSKFVVFCVTHNRTQQHRVSLLAGWLVGWLVGCSLTWLLPRLGWWGGPPGCLFFVISVMFWFTLTPLAANDQQR